MSSLSMKDATLPDFLEVGSIFNPLCPSRLNLYDDIEEFTVKLFTVQFSSGFFSWKALDICFYMQKTEVFYLV